MSEGAKVKIEFSSDSLNLFTKLESNVNGLTTALSGLKESIASFKGAVSGPLTEALGETISGVTGLKDVAEGTTSSSADLSDKLKKVATSTDQVGDAAKTVQSPMTNLREVLNEMGKSAMHFNNLRISVRDFTEAVHGFTKPARDMEDAMANIQAIAGDDLSRRDLKELGDAALSLGGDYGMAGKDVAAGYEMLLASMDVQRLGGVENLKKMGEEIVRFSKANDISMRDSANAITESLSNFGLEAEQAGKLMEVMTAGGKVGAANADLLMKSFQNVGGIPKTVGMTFQETTAIFEAMAAGGKKGESAGTALRNIIETMTQMGYKLEGGGFVKALQDINAQKLDPTALMGIFGAYSSEASALLANADKINEFNKKLSEGGSMQDMLDAKLETSNAKLEKLRATIQNTIAAWTENLTVMSPITEVLGYVATGVIGTVQAYDALKRITTLFTFAKAAEGEVTKMSMWTTIADAAAKLKAGIASKAMAIGNVLAAASTWTLAGSLVALRTAIFNIPLVGWILAGIAALAALIAYWDDFRYALLGTWEVLKGIVRSFMHLKNMDFSAAANELKNLGKAYTFGFESAKKADEAEKAKEGADQKKMDDLMKMIDNPVAEPSGNLLSATVPGADLGMGTSAASGGEIISAPVSGGATTNSQTVNVSAINITVATPRELVDQVKKEVIAALTQAMSPGVALAFGR